MTQPARLSDDTPAPSHVTTTRVNWAGVCDFVHLFRGFRLAINPAKLAIALLALLLLYGAGRLFDVVWGPQAVQVVTPIPDGNRSATFQAAEPEAYQYLKQDDYQRQRRDALTRRPERLLSELQSAEGVYLRPWETPTVEQDKTRKELEQISKEPKAAYARLKTHYVEQFHKDLDNIAKIVREAEEAQGKGLRSEKLRPEETIPEMERRLKREVAGLLADNVRAARALAGHGLFETFLDYELRQFDALVDNTLGLVRMTRIHEEPLPRGDFPADAAITGEAAVKAGLASRNPERLWRSDTLAGTAANATLTGPGWLAKVAGPMSWTPEGNEGNTWSGWGKMVGYRGLYLLTLVLLAAFALTLMALVGAILCRLTALEFAGHEQTPLMGSIRFGLRKLWEFVKAPLLPFALILAVGLLMALGGLLGAIPGVGGILLGVLFVLFLAGGFIIMLLALGIIGGYHLLFPTMAVEGSDSFDAMSRSFAYVFAKPWRLGWYLLVSLVYGVLTLLFISVALYLVLTAVHTFVGWGLTAAGAPEGAYSGLSKLETIWPAPRLFHLTDPVNWWALSTSEYLAAVLIRLWVYLTAAVAGAYAISYYFSSNTIVYYLLRRSVDGQSLNDVYLPGEGAVVAPAATNAAE